MSHHGFADLSRIHEGAHVVVFRGRRLADGASVVLKTLRGPYPSRSATRRLEREGRLLARVAGDGLVRLEQARFDDGNPVLVVEDFGGDSLAVHTRAGRLDVAVVLDIALQVVDALARLHAAMVVHKDLNPSNIVWNRQTGVAKLIDLGIASTVSRERPALASPRVLHGTLAYIAPEQTGRMNRSVDYRSDYYALGATLFELLTGRPPFEGDDPLELVHAHVARRPPDPRELEPSLKPDLAAVVLKLLSKTAEERYQSAYGLRRDLERCLATVRDNGPGDRFPLGRHDRPPRVQASGRLFGRDEEVAAVVGALQRVTGGAREVVLLQGPAGVGKTSVVHELHRPMVNTGGVFISGKFDQLRRGLPFASLADAFGQFCLGVLTGSPDEVAAWQRRLRDVVGQSGQVLVDLVPELELVLGPQPAAPVVPPSEVEQRLHQLIRRFVAAIAGPDNPLVLFVDDLQWADLSTIRLLRLLAKADDVTHLLIIGAWRDNEVDVAHPWTEAVALIRDSGVPLVDLVLTDLPLGQVRALLADALNDDTADLDGLAARCHARTRGNPFFLIRFLQAIEREGAITFDHATGRWTWDPARIDELGLTDNVIELMATTIRRLPAQSQRVLCIASMLGAAIDTGRLGRLAELEALAVEAAVHDTLEQGLLVEVGRKTSGEGDDAVDQAVFEFVHDRIQQAAYGLLPERERRQLHLRIGRMLHEELADDDAGDLIFDVVRHLGAAADLLTADERLALARLDLDAARRAGEAGSHGVALDLLRTGWDMVGPDAWSVDHDLATALCLGLATASYLVQRYADSDQWVQTLFDHARSELEQAEALEVRMAAQIARHLSDEAIHTGVEALGLLGVDLVEHPDLDAVMAAMGSCGALLQASDLSTLLEADAIEDARSQAVMRLLMDITPPAYLVRPLLMALLSTSIVERTVRQGLAPASAYGFALYGLMLCDAGYLDEGYGMGCLAVSLTERFPQERRIRVRTLHVHNGFCRHWKEPLRDFLDDYAELASEGFAIGDFEYGGFAALLTGMNELHASRRPLDQLEPQLMRYTTTMRNLSQDSGLSLHGIVHQTALNLLGQAEDERVLTGAVYDEAAMLAVFQKLQHPTGLFVLHSYKTILLFHLGEVALAEQAADVARAHAAAGGTATFHLPAFFTLDAVLALWRHERTGDDADLQRAIESREKVERWAQANPHNLRQKALMLQAEQARFEGRHGDALTAFEAAADAARENGFLADEAIANRLAGRYFARRGNHTVARAFLLECRWALQRWGATAALARLDAKHPDLAAGAAFGTRGTTMSGSWTETGGTDLDLAAVLRASQAISQEIKLSKLVQQLVKLALETSGARKAVLLLERDARFVVAAVGRFDVSLRIDMPTDRLLAEASPEIPASVIHFVQNTRREVLERDACTDGLFTADPYIEAHRVRSLLALPVEHKGLMNAILYLENDETRGVFNQDRLSTARVLLSQAAISIENATLYEQLEEKVLERTVQLEQARLAAEQARQESDALLENTLPVVIAEELKANGVARPVFVDSATVLFTDFRGFTARAQTMSPAELVEELEEYFTLFDEVMERWGVEKLKTIGDAYMAVGGVPAPNRTHAVDCVMAGLEICQIMARPQDVGDRPPFRVRVGLHTGPLVAGVIGRRRFAYDVWGDTVNTASRMESGGADGRVNVSAHTWSLVSDLFEGASRGHIAAKGKGELEMFFVHGLKPGLHQPGQPLAPTAAFWQARDRAASRVGGER